MAISKRRHTDTPAAVCPRCQSSSAKPLVEKSKADPTFDFFSCFACGSIWRFPKTKPAPPNAA